MHLAIVEAKGNTRPRPNRSILWSRTRSVAVLALAIAPVAVLIGCGNSYRPVVSAISPVGPAGQPQKFAVAISSPTPTSPGLVTIADFSGDTVMVTASVGVNPYYLALNSTGSEGYTLNSDGTVNSFAISTTLMTNDVQQTTLLPGANPASLFAGGTYTFIDQPGRNSVAEFTGIPPSLQQELPATPGYQPIYTVGVAGAPRSYSITQKPGGGIGQVLAIDNGTPPSTPTITNTIPVGNNPIYGIMTSDGTPRLHPQPDRRHRQRHQLPDQRTRHLHRSHQAEYPDAHQHYPRRNLSSLGGLCRPPCRRWSSPTRAMGPRPAP